MFEKNDRIRLIRDERKLSRSAFGKNIGVSGDVIKNLDYHITEPKSLLLDQISNFYKVRREWLEKGEGEMYAPVPNEKTEFDTYHLLISDLPDADFKKKFYNALMKLTDEQWDFLEGIVALLTEAENAKKEEGEP